MPLVTTTPGNFDDLISSTLQIYAPRVEDNFYNALPLWHMLNRAGAVKMYDGGESFVVPVLFADNTTAKRMATGYDDISVSPQNNMTAAQYIPRQYAVSITISRREELANRSEARAIDLLQQKVESAELAIRNLLNGDGFSNSLGVAGSLLGMQEAFENKAQASQVNTVGGISKTTYSFWRHQYASVANAFGTNGRNAMAQVYNLCSGGSSDHPTMIATDRPTYENFERTIEPIERLQPLGDHPGAVGDPRFELLKFRGAMVFFDLAAPTGNMYFINPRYYYLKVHSADHFYVTPFVKFPNQLARVAQISWTGQIIVSNMRRLGMIELADTF